MTDLLAMSADIIDHGANHGPINRINHELSELDNNLALVEAFSHSVVFDSKDGLVVFDTSGAQGGASCCPGHSWLAQNPFQHPDLYPWPY